MFTLKEGALFIADAHENEDRRGFWDFLQALEGDKIRTPRLSLMGDIFDLLVWEVSANHSFAMPCIVLPKRLCEKMEIYYLEGDHDFNLGRFFQKVCMIPLQNQPLILRTSKGKNERLFLAHGNIFLSPILQFLLKGLRNRFLLRFLNVLNFLTFSSISKQILAMQKGRNLFCKIENFRNLAYKRYEKYQAKGAWVIKGYYHQNLFLREERVEYFNLPSFAYERGFFVIKLSPEVRFKKQ